MPTHYPMTIEDSAVYGTGTFEVRDPATGTIFAQVPEAFTDPHLRYVNLVTSALLLGYEGAGEIALVGGAVTGFAVGVLLSFSSCGRCPVRGRSAGILPDVRPTQPRLLVPRGWQPHRCRRRRPSQRWVLRAVVARQLRAHPGAQSCPAA